MDACLAQDTSKGGVGPFSPAATSVVRPDSPTIPQTTPLPTSPVAAVPQESSAMPASWRGDRMYPDLPLSSWSVTLADGATHAFPYRRRLRTLLGTSKALLSSDPAAPPASLLAPSTADGLDIVQRSRPSANGDHMSEPHRHASLDVPKNTGTHHTRSSDIAIVRKDSTRPDGPDPEAALERHGAVAQTSTHARCDSHVTSGTGERGLALSPHYNQAPRIPPRSSSRRLKAAPRAKLKDSPPSQYKYRYSSRSWVLNTC